MLRKLYALLVGINAYPSTVDSLSGCVNDVQNMEAFLEGWVDRNSFQLEIKKLIDEQATRNNIVEGFRTHLCQATSSDVALFFFAGHGSQERTLPQLLHFEPDRLDETLVCWDSRQHKGWDLADKELAWLISEVSNKNPHIVIILDCCHSGSGTRQERGKIRRISKQTKSRPEDSYLFNIEEFVQTNSIDFSETPSGWSLGNKGRHVLLAACESGQTAKEYKDKEGKDCGRFSYFLIETLNKSNGQLTYKELMTHTSALVCRVTSEQTPQLEAPTREDINRFFLDGALAQRLPHFTVRYDKNYEWCLDAGKIHGLPDVKSSEPIRIALYPFDASGTDLEKVSNAIAFGKITKVLPHQSRVEIEGSKLSVNDTFKAVIVSLPLEPFGIFLSGEECGLSNLRQAIKGRAIGRGNARFFQEVVNVNDAKLSVKAVENRYSIRDLITDKIAAEVTDYSNTELVVTYLENIVCWHNVLADLDSQTKTLPDDAVELKVYHNSSEINHLLELSYTYEDGVWHRPSFRLKLKNNYHKRLYCSLIGLSEDYSVTSSFLPNGGIWLEPGEEAWAHNGNPIRTKVLDVIWKKGGTITKDWLRFIVSTDEFDAGLLDQKPLEAVTVYNRGLTRSYRHKNRLNWLLNRYVTRHFDLDDELYSKWTTKLLSITTTRLQESVSFQENNHGSRSAIIQHEQVKCVVEAPMNLEAELRLASKIEKNRSTLPDILQEDIFDKPLEFVLPQGSSPALNIIELDNICNPETVATSTLLSITVNFDNKEVTGLDENSNMLAVGYNGEFYIPLGLAKSTEKSVNLTLSYLPGVGYQAQRSVRQSLYLFFQKFLAKPMGVDYQYPRFALAEV
ncbi:MAG: caspase family protein, partial [Blastocatellia bacterium]|nr:caspase family protein [Blastocatellia bacterium]